MPDRDGITDHVGIWVYGDPGVGKSHWANAQFPGAFYKEPNNKWWDEYASEKVVILDEFVGGVQLSLLLRWVDKYKCKAESKGSMLRLFNTTTVVLSNLPPWDLYPNVKPIRKAALYRRFKVYEMFNLGGLRSRSLRHPPGTRQAIPRRPGNPVAPQLVRQNATVGTDLASLSERSERVLAFAQGFRRFSSGHVSDEDFDN